ncbi:hypothetical protein BH23GEM6_BH23GEM6_24960 [soil metagenome]
MNQDESSSQDLIWVVVEDADGTSEELLAIQLDENRCRLEESPAFVDGYGFGDTIEVEPDEEGFLVARRVLHRASMVQSEITLPRHVSQTQGFQNFCHAVHEVGGQWSILFGGILLVDVPEDSGFDAAQELETMTAADPGPYVTRARQFDRGMNVILPKQRGHRMSEDGEGSETSDGSLPEGNK